MEYLIYLIMFMTGTIIGGMFVSLRTKREINQYVASILMDDNNTLRLLEKRWRAELDQCKQETLELVRKLIISQVPRELGDTIIEEQKQSDEKDFNDV